MDWMETGIAGTFAIVEHTSQGSILLYDHGDTVQAYRVVGITQSIESLLTKAPGGLPFFGETAIFSFKGLILNQGTLMGGMGPPSANLIVAAADHVNGNRKLEVITNMG